MQPLRELLLDRIQRGENHRREKFKLTDVLPYDNFVEIGQILRACATCPELAELLLDRLAPFRSSIVGALPQSMQSHGLVADAASELSVEELRASLLGIADKKLKQWIIDDSSLIYGELSRDELDTLFLEINQTIEDRRQFVDLGSGLGKVVMTAAVSIPFTSYRGVELVPYRHSLALQRFDDFCLTIESELAPSFQHSHNFSYLTDDYAADIPLLRTLRERVSFELGDLLSSDLSVASLIFMYSTCFGSFIHKIADKIARDAPKGCLVITTTYAFDHPGLYLVKHYPSKSLAWTDIRIYRRVGEGPWPVSLSKTGHHQELETWKKNARDLLQIS